MNLWGTEKGTEEKSLRVGEDGVCVAITQQSVMNWPCFETTLSHLETGERFTGRKMVKLNGYSGREYWADVKTGTLYHVESGRNAGGSPLTIAERPTPAGTIQAGDGPSWRGDR